MFYSMRVCLGGTFDNLHRGHKELLDKSLELAGKKGFLFIGLTTDAFIKNKKNVNSFYKRKKEIESYLEEKKVSINVNIQPINNRFGPTIEEDFDVIVVSPESYKTAIEINRKREYLGKKPMKIVKIPFVLAEDNKPISSTRIRNKEVDAKGRLVKD